MEGEGRPSRKADNLTVKYGSLDVSQPYGPSWSVTGIVLLFIHNCCSTNDIIRVISLRGMCGSHV
jgi:hypothetical protein